MRNSERDHVGRTFSQNGVRVLALCSCFFFFVERASTSLRSLTTHHTRSHTSPRPTAGSARASVSAHLEPASLRMSWRCATSVLRERDAASKCTPSAAARELWGLSQQPIQPKTILYGSFLDSQTKKLLSRPTKCTINVLSLEAVSYTTLPLPTNREV